MAMHKILLAEDDNDMMIVRGVNVFPTQIEELILKRPELAPHYQCVLRRNGSLDALQVVVETQAGIDPQSKGIESARLDAEILLAFALSADRLRLYLDFDKPVALPCSPGALLETLSKAFTSLTGAELTRGGQFPVARFARGGMSSGFVSCDFWTQDLIPTLQLRLQWLCESWAWKKP